MTANRKSMPRKSLPIRVKPTRKAVATDLAALDALKARPDADAPEFTEAEIAAGAQSLAARKRGRPKADVTKQRITLRLSPEVLRGFRATGAGWQTRMDDVLKRAVKRLSDHTASR